MAGQTFYSTLGFTGLNDLIAKDASSAPATVESGTRYLIDTSGGSFTFNLSASPSEGDVIELVDKTGNWAANPLTVDPGAQTIEGVAATALLNNNFGWSSFVYTGSTWVQVDLGEGTGGGGGGAVTAVFGRTGNVTAASGDYNATQLSLTAGYAAAAGTVAIGDQVEEAIEKLDGGKLNVSLLAAKGDLISASAADTPSVISVSGNDGSYLVEDSAAASGWSVSRNNFAATVAPTATDDSTAGYAVGSTWIDTTADSVYKCVDATATAAVWSQLDASATLSLQAAYDGDTDGSDALITTNATDGAVVIAGDQKLQVTATSGLDVDTQVDVDLTGPFDVDGAQPFRVGSNTAVSTFMVDATGDVQIDSTTSNISLDGVTSSNFTVTGSAQNLTLEAAGGGTQTVLIQSAGTGNDAVDINASAGGITASAVLNSDITVTGAAQDLTLEVAGGGAQQLILRSAGTGVDALRLDASAGGMDLDALGNITVTAGDAATGGGSISLQSGADSDESGTGALISLTSAVGDAGSNIQMTPGGANTTPGAIELLSQTAPLGSTARLRFYDEDNSNYVSFRAATTVAGNVEWTLPSADGAAGQALVTDGAGQLVWANDLSKLVDELYPDSAVASSGTGSIARGASPWGDGHVVTLSDGDAAAATAHDISLGSLAFANTDTFQFRVWVAEDTLNANHVISLAYSDDSNSAVEFIEIGSGGASVVAGGADAGNVSATATVTELDRGTSRLFQIDMVLTWAGASGTNPLFRIVPAYNLDGTAVAAVAATGSASLWDIALGAVTEFVAASANVPHEVTFDATTDWGVAASGLYTQTIAITAATHAKGTRPMVEVVSDDGTNYIQVTPDSVSYNKTTGDVSVTLTALETPDGRFAGAVLVY